jgi:hypothetical protein
VPKIKLELGAELDVLGKDEFEAGLNKAHVSLMSELARGLKSVRVNMVASTAAGQISAGVLDVGGDDPDQPFYGPRPGFVWAVHRISVYGTAAVAAGDAIKVYRGNDGISSNFICQIIAPGMQLFSKGQLLLNGGEVLAFAGVSITSTEIGISVEATEAPGPMVYKVIA